MTASTGEDADLISADRITQMLQERQPIPQDDDLLDPLEYAFRRVVPIPKHYYWDVVTSEEAQKEIPKSIQYWHSTIYTLHVAFQWIDRKVARPMATTMGLTSSRFEYVTQHMTKEEMDEARTRAEVQNQSVLALRKQSEQQLELETCSERVDSVGGDDDDVEEV